MRLLTTSGREWQQKIGVEQGRVYYELSDIGLPRTAGLKMMMLVSVGGGLHELVRSKSAALVITFNFSAKASNDRLPR